jgi:hypothetical protein
LRRSYGDCVARAEDNNCLLAGVLAVSFAKFPPGL